MPAGLESMMRRLWVAVQIVGYVNCEMTLLPDFDDWLAAVLAEQATDAGESIDRYVARAVAARLVADVSERDGHQLEELHNHLSVLGLAVADRLGSPDAVITDPERLSALYATRLLDSPPEQAYDRIVGLAAEALRTPFAAIRWWIADRQFSKSLAGATGPMAEQRQILHRTVRCASMRSPAGSHWSFPTRALIPC